MMKKWVFLFLAIYFVAACSAIPVKTTETEKLQQFFAAEWDYVMLEFPVWATSMGYPGQDHRWDEISFAAHERRDARIPKVLQRLQAIDREKLSKADQLNYDLFENSLLLQIEGMEFPGEYLQISQMGGIHSRLAGVFNWAPARSLDDYENLLKRMQGVPAQVEGTMAFLKAGLEKGVTPPKVTLRDVPEQIKAQLVLDDHPAMKIFNRFPDSIPEKEQEAIRARANEILKTQVIPVYQQFYDFIVEQYLPNCRTTVGFSALPNGEKWYANNVKNITTTDLTPKEIHEIGLAEVARLKVEMQVVLDELEFEGELEDFFNYLKTDEQFRFSSREELLTAYRAVAKTADYGLLKQFRHLPRLPYGIEPVPSFREKSAATAYIHSGNLKTGKPGTFFVNTYNLPSRYRWELEPLTLHEAVPGHHLQSAIASEQEFLPNFRKHGFYTAYVEGWGLYAEKLGYELGLYQDPYSRFGQLGYEMWRAVRLVVDTGLHAFNWSRDEAIEYFITNTGRSEHDTVVEIDRYIVWPGQALAYKVGEMKITELREYSRKELGAKFDVRDFHDLVLANGAVPLNILDRMVKEWVTEEKTEQQK